MSYRHIAGLDPSYTCTGYAAPNGTTHRITTRIPTTAPTGHRLDDLLTNIISTISLHPPRPDLIIIEGYVIGFGNDRGSTAVRLGELGGVIRRELWRLGIDYHDTVTPTNLKRFATGHGDADDGRMVQAALAHGWRDHNPHRAPLQPNGDEADAYELRRMGRCAHSLDTTRYDYERDALSKPTW